jgi:ribose 5-phosphate isomerase B
MSDEEPTRDRVRALVREVLAHALPADEAEGTNVAAATGEAATGDAHAGLTARTASLSSSAAAHASQINVRTPEHARTVQVAPPIAGEEEQPFTRDESSKTVITETDVHGLEAGARLRIAEGARLTPLAADIVRERRIEIVRRASRRGTRAEKLIAVGSDHGGFKMKEELKILLAELGHRVRDFGTNSTDAVDYPDFAHAVARAVSEGNADLGIIIDGAGVGSAMTANKVPGVRAAACYSVQIAKNSREHNDANVLTLGSGTINADEMREIVAAWLSTEITEERHKKRVAKIEAVERQYRC